MHLDVGILKNIDTFGQYDDRNCQHYNCNKKDDSNQTKDQTKDQV